MVYLGNISRTSWIFPPRPSLTSKVFHYFDQILTKVHLRNYRFSYKSTLFLKINLLRYPLHHGKSFPLFGVPYVS